MATVVVSTPFAGSVQQVQVGPADLVATVTAAHAAWGWVGGLSDEAFGGTLSSKLVGMTFCALAYTMKPRQAIDIFMDFFVDALFKKGLCNYPGSKEALHTFLIDNHQAILNDGAIHHLPEKFQDAISRFEVITGWRGKSPRDPRLVRHFRSTEATLINGFLRWLVRDIRDPYYTRSAAVARIAACLRCVGYKIGETAIWDGIGQRPSLHRTLILVTGGASETDDLMDESIFQQRPCDLITHYRWNTAGAMLWNSLLQDCEYSHEMFQEDFDDINATLEKSLEFRWTYVDTGVEEIQAFPVWINPRPSSSPTATRIATIFFPESVDRISTLYQRVSNERYLKAALSRKGINAQDASIQSKELHRIQIIAASVCLAVLGKLGGSNFAAIQHSTTINLSYMANIRWLCGEVDAILTGGCVMSRVIKALAAIHCAVEFPERTDWYNEDFNAANTESNAADSQVVGWRNGRYAILPNLLFAMEKPLEKSILSLQCVDGFIANLPTRRNGALCCPIGLPGPIGFNADFIEEVVKQEGRDPEGQALAHDKIRPIILGPPRLECPDKPLYITLERPPYGSGDPEISICGRLEGESLGHVGIQDILITLALSWHDAEGQPYQACSPREGHEKPSQASDQLPARKVFNMAPSAYYRYPGIIPRCKEDQEPRHHVYVQVSGDTPWTLFLAGQSSFLNRIVFGCPDCAVNAGANYISSTSNGLRTLIGYQ
ncbi:uncharacterized protein PAC_13118 [Phialocephala subalpina]|uniref:Uncharacterized protein n=1 Tax=Phialocephala subalpina TaxID=576137 RepID=A0A1L7XDW8_9HELO|nr:uncharacterized protein PAC_13118 [Phialocephala subalpina]